MRMIHRWVAWGVLLTAVLPAMGGCGGSYATQPASESRPASISPVGPPGIY